MKSLVIHGAYQTSNFGDQLLLEVLARHLVQRTGRTPVCPWLAPDEKGHEWVKRGDGLLECWRAEAAIMGGGGYFVDDGSYMSIRRLMRYLLPALIWRVRRIPYMILAVGAGPHLSSLARFMVRLICGGARFVIVRDDESKALLVASSVSPDKVIVTADLIIGMEKSDIPSSAIGDAERLLSGIGGRHVLGLHFSLPITEIDTLKLWLNEVRKGIESAPVDCVIFFDHSDAAYDDVKAACEGTLPNALVLRKQSFWATAALIGRLDGVITTKLHVGIAAWALGVAPCAIASHGKTRRFYKQIGREDFCVDKSSAVPALAAWTKLFASQPAEFRENLNERRASLKARYRQNLSMLDRFLMASGALRPDVSDNTSS